MDFFLKYLDTNMGTIPY